MLDFDPSTIRTSISRSLELECPSPFYHSSDLGCLGLSDARRLELKASCIRVADALAPLFGDPNALSEGPALRARLDPEGIRELHDALCICRARQRGAGLYDYSLIYVSENPRRAIEYSRDARVYGELGHVASCLVKYARVFDLEVPASGAIGDDIRLLDAAGARRPSPVVVAFLDLRWDQLLQANGRPLLLLAELGPRFFLRSTGSYRLSDDVSFDAGMVVPIDFVKQFIDDFYTR